MIDKTFFTVDLTLPFAVLRVCVCVCVCVCVFTLVSSEEATAQKVSSNQLDFIPRFLVNLVGDHEQGPKIQKELRVGDSKSKGYLPL